MHFRLSKYLPKIRHGEKVYLVMRRHWFIPFVKAGLWIFLAVVVVAGMTYLKQNFGFFAAGTPQKIIDVFVSVFLILVALGLLIVWTMYYLNVQMVTNKRIIDINQKSIIHHESTELRLEKVQDVTTEIKGPLANLFNYGNVFIQTAGTEQNFVFDHVSSPMVVAKTVLTLAGNASAHYKNSFSGNNKNHKELAVKKNKKS